MITDRNSRKNVAQQRVKKIAGKSLLTKIPACRRQARGFSWFVFYLLNLLLKLRNFPYTNTLQNI
jgi:hypothetical protein